MAGMLVAVAVPAVTRPGTATVITLGGALAIVAMLAYAHLDVIVTDEELLIRFRPFHLRGRRIPLRDIAEAQARTYSPLGEYGGWGIRLGSRGMAYNAYGNRGVQIVLVDGRQILIGSQRSEELAAALQHPAPR